MTHISVDPYAWLKPIYAQLRATPAFARLAPASQFLELCRAATEHSPRKAEAMREWHPEAQSALLKHLSDSLDELPHPRSRHRAVARPQGRTHAPVRRRLSVDRRRSPAHGSGRFPTHRTDQAARACRSARVSMENCVAAKSMERGRGRAMRQRDRFRKPRDRRSGGSACTPARIWSVPDSTAAGWITGGNHPDPKHVV